MRLRKCKVCHEEYQPQYYHQILCGNDGCRAERKRMQAFVAYYTFKEFLIKVKPTMQYQCQNI